MKILTRTLIIIALTLACLMGTLALVSGTLLLESYTSLEEQGMQEQVQRAARALDNEIASIDRMNQDWAKWDDTYAFIDDRNEEYIGSNLVDETFSNLGLNLILYVGDSGTIVYSEAFDLSSGSPVPLPDEVVERIIAEERLIRHQSPEGSSRGIIRLPEGLMLISSQPITTSTGEGPVRGVLLMGRYLDEAMVGYLADTAQLSIVFLDPDGGEIPGDVETALQASGGVAVLPTNDEVVSGYAALTDLAGTPAAVLRVDAPRTIYRQGLAAITYLFFALLVVGVAFGIVSVCLLKNGVISRVASLNTDVTVIGASGDFASRLPETGDDEITGLAGAINGMLHALEESNDRYRLLFNTGSDLTLVYSVGDDGSPGKILEACDQACSRLGYTREELLGLPASALIGTDIAAAPMSPALYAAEMRGKDGTPIPVEASSRAITLDDRRAELVVARDITERRRAEQQLEDTGFTSKTSSGNGRANSTAVNSHLTAEIKERRRAEESLKENRQYLETILESIQAGIVVIDPKTHTIADANPAALRMVGASRGEMLGRECYRYICPQQRGNCPITDSGQQVDNAERTLLTAHGSSLPILKTVVPVRLRGEAYLLESFIDITERKQAEEELERKVAERTADLQAATGRLREEIEERTAVEAEKMKAYEQIDRNMEQFAILNDHIRNPLQVIVGIAGLEETPSSAKIVEQAMAIDGIVTELDRGWIESEKIRAFLRKHS